MGRGDASRRFTNRGMKSSAQKRASQPKRPRADKEEEKKLDSLLPAIYSVIPDEPKSFKIFPTEAKLWARHAWWSGRYSVTEIAEAIDVEDATVNRWIKGNSRAPGWRDDKEKSDQKALKKVVKDNAQRLDGVIEKMITALEKTALNIIDENARLSIDDFNKMVNAFEKLFKVRQLSLGKATEIFAGADGELPTWAEVRKKMEEVEVPAFEVVDG